MAAGKLYINGLDAYTTYGVMMGEGFLDALGAPVSMKEYIENSSRLEHGKRTITSNAKVDSRELTLTFTIRGSSPADFRTKKKAFYAMLYAGSLTVKVPSDSEDIYHLNYLGKNITYAQNISRNFAKIGVKFEEPNPMDRS